MDDEFRRYMETSQETGDYEYEINQRGLPASA